MLKPLFVSFIVCLSTAGMAQKTSKNTPPAKPTDSTTTTGTKGSTGVKPYSKVITDKAITHRGLFTVHKVEDKYYFEIADSNFNREIMAVTRYVKVPANGGVGRATYGGEQTNEQTISFEKGPNNVVFMRVITIINMADSSNVISTAVKNSNLNPIAAAFPIAAYGKDSASAVIDVTDYFKGDNQVVSINQNAKKSFNLSSLANDRSYIESIKAFPLNIEVRTVKTFNASTGTGSTGNSSYIPAANAAGAVTIELNTSMILLPKTPMDVRYWDRRVGFFADRYTTYSDMQQRTETNTFAVRWRLEPKDEDLERWKNGALVEPKKPIVYYIDPATPKKWRSYLIQGINDWQVAFEHAGFKNAIVGKEWPIGDTNMSLEDSRYSVLRYFASDVENAYGPNVHDPRSGEILESHIGWYHNVMKLVHDWYMIQTAAVDTRARKMNFDDSLMGELIRFVSSHEVGHTLGLRHNMGNSSTTPVENLRNKAWVEKHGHTGSIMDYARFNYVAQPEDNITSKGLFPRIGDYDKWAIKWGYGYIPGKTEKEQKEASHRLIVKALKQNPRHYFGSYEFGNADDPRNQSEDLGDNAMTASRYGIKNLQYIVKRLPEWTQEETDLNKNVDEMYTQLVGQFRRYMFHVTANVGGVYETFKSSVQPEPVYEVTPKAKQKQAVAFLHEQLFETPHWLIAKTILDRTKNPGDGNAVASVQEATLNNLVRYDRLNRMQESVARFGHQDAYSAMELLTDVQKGLFEEVGNKKPIDIYRRRLQKSYVDKLTRMVNPSTTGTLVIASSNTANLSANDISKTDIPAIAREQLRLLRAKISGSLGSTSDQMSRIHLADLNERIKDALTKEK